MEEVVQINYRNMMHVWCCTSLYRLILPEHTRTRGISNGYQMPKLALVVGGSEITSTDE